MLSPMSSAVTPIVQAVIFDLDGLLLDTEPIYMDATRTVLARRRAELDTDLWWRLTGQPSLVVLRSIVEEAGLSVRAEQLLAERQMVLDRHLGRAQALPGAEQLVHQLAADGVPIAIATSSTRRAYLMKSRQHPWLEQFDAVVTRDDVPLGKPAPDLFLEAARRLGQPPERCLAIENASSGLRAGRAAGMTTVIVPTDGMDLEAFKDADQLLESLEQFRPAEWGLTARDTAKPVPDIAPA